MSLGTQRGRNARGRSQAARCQAAPARERPSPCGAKPSEAEERQRLAPGLGAAAGAQGTPRPVHHGETEPPPQEREGLWLLWVWVVGLVFFLVLVWR